MFRNCPMIGRYFDHCTCMHMCMHAYISVAQVLITNALFFSLNRTTPVVEVLQCESLANSSRSLRCPPMRWVTCVALYNRSAFTVNVDVINYHVTLLHNEFLSFRMAGTMFHRMRIPVSYFVWQTPSICWKLQISLVLDFCHLCPAFIGSAIMI